MCIFVIEMIEDILLDGFYKSYCNSLVYNKTKQEELLSEFHMLVLTAVTKERLEERVDSEGFRKYGVVMIRNLVYNKNSSYRKNNNDFIELTEMQEAIITEPIYFDNNHCKELLKEIDEQLKEDSKQNEGLWADEMIFNTYFKNFNSYRKMSKETKIPVISLFNSVKETQGRIKVKQIDKYNQIKNARVF